jgi:hypothetical protein
MQSRATITNAKVAGSEYGRESTLTLTLEVRLPIPVEVKPIHEWAASDLDYSTRQEIANAQRRRREAKQTKKLSKAEKKAQEEAHEGNRECSVASCESCYPTQPDEQFVCLAHQSPLMECPECDEESAVYLDPEDVATLRAQYDTYLDGQRQINHLALAAAQEAALFLLLIKKPVLLSIAPAQQAFADLLQLAAPQG